MSTAAPYLDVTNPNSAHMIAPELAAQTLALRDELEDLAIVDVDGLTRAVEARQRIADAQAKVVAFFLPIKQMAHKLHRAICERENAILDPLVLLDSRHRQAITAFKVLEDDRRQAAERAIAERERAEREARAADEAAALEHTGDHALAAAVLEEAVSAPAPVVALPDVTRTVPGLKFTRRWKWRYAGGPADVKLTTPEVIQKARALIPPAFLSIDEKKIGDYVRSMKGSGAIPGIEIYAVDEPIR